MAEVQQCETENPGQNLPDLARAAHRHLLYVAAGQLAGSHSASTPSIDINFGIPGISSCMDQSTI